MTEDFVQFLWAERLILPGDLRTKEGLKCEVIKSGTWNFHSGPDFKDAVLRLGDTTWVGHVEVHLKSSDWYLHQHQNDPAYESVILHIVLDDDHPVLNAGGQTLPCMELKSQHYQSHYLTYENWLVDRRELPCVQRGVQVPEALWWNWLEDLGRQRFAEKINLGWSTLESTQGNIEWTRWILLARTMGAPLNEEGMELLVRSIPWNQVRRRDWSFLEFKHWMLWMAGLSADGVSEHLKKVFSLQPMNKRNWLYGKLRPPSFPAVRVAQWSWYFYTKEILKSSTDEFWSKSFWEGYPEKIKPGVQTLHAWRVNMTPFTYIGNWNREQASAEVWRNISPEKNSIISQYHNHFPKPRNAFDTQAILKLNKAFCRSKKCLNCAVGNHHLKKKLND